MLWDFNAPSIKRVPESAILDPTNKTDMVKPWANYPSVKPYLQNPCNSGGIESNPAYDPVKNIAIVATYNCPKWDSIVPTVGKGVPYGSFGLNLTYVGPNLPRNTTLWAINVDTGKPLWQFDIANIGYRGGVDISGGLVFVPAADGYLRALNEQTGKLVMQMHIGAPLCTEPAIAQDTNGIEEIVFPVCSSHETYSPLIANNGVMVALALASPMVTSTASTSHATSPSVPLAAFLSVAAVAVVFIVATGALVMRRKKP
jgi:outer membrane protein assembly factor BamB